MSDAWVEAKFRVCYLTEQHRQGNDYLNDILNTIRSQILTLRRTQALQATRQQDIGEIFHVYIRIIWTWTPSTSNI